MVTIDGKMGDSRHARSSVTSGTVCGFRRRMTEMVGLRSSSRQIFQKGKDAGGTAASKQTMPPHKKAERFI